MKIALIGATGNAGSRILAELAGRGHAVTAISRRPRSALPPGTVAVAADAGDPAALAPVLRGHDAAISSIHFLDSDVEALLAAVKAAAVPRYLVVGGAGSLEAAPGLRVVDAPGFPEAYRAEALAGAAFLDRLRREDALDWTFLSPAAQFVPGERTGRFRLGGDSLLVGADGESRISFEDYAVALADEVENPRHARRRFTVGY